MRKLWRTHQDYGSQLWSPVAKPGDIKRQEAPLRAFTKRVKRLSNKTYWDRLKVMRLLSTERRVERYTIIYTWKVLQGVVHNCGVLAAPDSLRRGRQATVPSLTGSNQVPKGNVFPN